MKIIREKKIGMESRYQVSEKIDDYEINEYFVNIKCGKTNIKGVQKYLLYNSQFEVITDAYLFLNKNPKNIASNTKNNYFYALKSLYTFLEIVNKDLSGLLIQDFYQLNSFLKGISATGSDYEFILNTKRSNKTINIFFSVYREYFKYLGLKKSPLLEVNSFSKFIPERHFVGKSLSRDVTPRYISMEEYHKVMEILSDDSNEYTLRNKCIIRLMYEGGLRIGEVLGITLEDTEIKWSENGDKHLIIFVRNRFSDKDFQRAKTCINISSKRAYVGHDYITENVGYQKAIVFDFDGIDTYSLICKYIDKAHEEIETKYLKKYKTTLADSVDSFKKENKDNHYLFLNTRGGVLSDVSWNSELRKIFQTVNIPIDCGYRKHNLNHRFRHGFVMHLLYDMNLEPSKVKAFTRHRNDNSLNAYNNPTIEDVIRLKEELSEYIHSQDDENDEVEDNDEEEDNEN